MKKIPPKKAHIKTSWEPVAGWYDKMLKGEDTYQEKVVLPNLLRILPATPGKKMIDIACGQGFFSKVYAAGGATVLGIDLSRELIKKAKLVSGENLKFEVANANKIPADKESFDGAFIVLALQNIKEMSAVIKEACRVLVRGGKLVIVLNHPAFRILKASSWQYDEEKEIQYRRIDKYGIPFEVEVDMTPGAKSEEEKVHTVSFHRPIQDYFKAIVNAGFCVTGLEEWISHKQSEFGPRSLAENIARKEFPMFMAIVAEKR
ncbi:MAG: class I SAM-dependent methyltransferase [Patescibacteria group bacterium]